jgi:putative Mg2+ transporter-C (MgtC) family protein
MTWIDFAIRLAIAFILGVGIGIERQWLKTRSVLKTNVLVTLGAAMFVMLSVMTPGEASPTRIAAQVVSGIGFLGGGVILRDGASVRGINTAATLWCAGAIGSLVGAGFLVQAYFGTLAVVGANLLLRPMVHVFQKKIDEKIEPPPPLNGGLIASLNSQSQPLLEDELLEEDEDNNSSSLIIWQSQFNYQCRFICHLEDKVLVLTKLCESLLENQQNINLTSMQNHQLEDDLSKVEILVNFVALENQNDLEFIVSTANLLQTTVTADFFDWEFSKDKIE